MVRIPIDREKLADYCRRHHIVKMALFGSALRDDFRPDSDIDVLVTFEPGFRYSLFMLVDMEDELQQILGREVDLVDRLALAESDNYIVREGVLSTAIPIYGD